MTVPDDEWRVTLTDDEFRARVQADLDAHKDDPPVTWWLSFADPAKPPGEQFLGAMVVDHCRSLVEARLQLTLHGVESPGGEIKGRGFTLDGVPPDVRDRFNALPRLTLLSREELARRGIK